MAIISQKNQYPGINAHFQSIAQNTRDGWHSFHSVYITDLMRHIQTLVSPRYVVAPEASIQIVYDEDMRPHYPRPDLGVYDGADQPSEPTIYGDGTAVATPIKTLALPVMALDEDVLNAVLIRDEQYGQLIARIEVLSPSNKTDRRYLALRERALDTCPVLVEIDFLHETDSPLVAISSYIRQQPNAYPYTIVVTDVRPRHAYTKIYGFGVDESILAVEVPLADEDKVLINFGTPYHTALSSYVYSRQVDYAKEPPAMDTYHPADQRRIWARMLAVIEAVKSGQDLNNAPFPAKTDALAQLEPYTRASLLLDPVSLAVSWLVQRPDGATGVILPENQWQPATHAYAMLKDIFDHQGYAALINHLKGA